jgi:hypothetical protein
VPPPATHARRPGRWAEFDRPPSAFNCPSFHAGARSCLGQRLAELEGVYVLVRRRGPGSASCAGGYQKSHKPLPAPWHARSEPSTPPGFNPPLPNGDVPAPGAAPGPALARLSAHRQVRRRAPRGAQVTLLRRFRLALVPGPPAAYELSVSLPVKGGLWATAEERVAASPAAALP